MKSIVKRVLILLGIFAASLIFFTIALNRHEVEKTKSMGNSTLPVFFMKENDSLINRMYGYRQSMDETTLRNNLTLLPADKTLTVSVKAYGNDINDAEYQVTSLKDGGVVENGKIKTFETDGEYLTATFSLNAEYEMKQEYMLRFTVSIGGFDTYYYTRIVQRNGQSLDGYIAYAQSFYQNCLNKNLTEDMLNQLETDSSKANSSLHSVTLKSDKEQLKWGNLTTTLVKEAVPTVLEINETTVSLSQEYIISSADSNEKEETYIVKEFYRMRANQDSIVLLDYERTATQFFDGQLSVLDSTSLNLGITGRDVNYTANDNADIVAFAQAGELWQYDRSANKVTKLFGFKTNDLTDDRIFADEFNISIAAVSNEGNTTFIAYGYMASGGHEGTVGISIYQYDSKTNTIRELLFVPITDSYELAELGLSRLAYVNTENQCFLYYDDTIYMIQIDDGTVTTLQSELSWQEVSTSDSQMRVAWNTTDSELPKQICELNLETGETTNIDSPDGDSIKVLGYAGEDIIYGLAHDDSCYRESNGKLVFPMYRVCIRNQQGELVKDYSIDGVYVMSIKQEDDLIILDRAENQDGVWKSISEDRFIHYMPDTENVVDIKLTVDNRKGTEVKLAFSMTGEVSNLLTMDARYSDSDNIQRLEIEELKYSDDNYYVYSEGGLKSIYKSINSAIAAADDSKGVVLNSRQQYVWERGNVQTSIKLDPASIPQGILSANTDDSSIADAVGADYEVWDLSGCSLDSICYQISNGYAVVGKWSDGSSRIILGYDQYNVWFYDASSGGLYAVATEDAQPQFEASGNIFISYHI